MNILQIKFDDYEAAFGYFVEQYTAGTWDPDGEGEMLAQSVSDPGKLMIMIEAFVRKAGSKLASKNAGNRRARKRRG